jgi:hypothetical protein
MHSNDYNDFVSTIFYAPGTEKIASDLLNSIKKGVFATAHHPFSPIV